MWADLAAIGRDPSGAGYWRFSWTEAENACREWFHDQATGRGLEVRIDGNGNQIAWWPATDSPGASTTGGGGDGRSVVTGSHLDSVPGGGAYDGPLGVVSALAAVDMLVERGFAPSRPIGIATFAEEEGGRFGVPCLGSRLLTGLIDADKAAELTDANGITFAKAKAAAGYPAKLGPDPEFLGDPMAFVELHVEQGRALVETDRAVGVASAIWPHGRWRFEFGGEANHAGTTRLVDRRDPMLTFAETVLSARKKAKLAEALATFAKLQVEPNGTNAIPSLVQAWMDARAADEETLAAVVDDIVTHARSRASRDGTTLAVERESLSAAVSFEGAISARVQGILPAAPVLPTGAGHDAGVLSGAGVPTAMLFVRNPTGVSHAPAEFAEEADCLAGVAALADVLEDLAG